MRYRTFSIRLPEQLAIKLDAESRKRFFKKRGRTQLLVEILTSRYEDELSKLASRRKKRDEDQTEKVGREDSL